MKNIIILGFTTLLAISCSQNSDQKTEESQKRATENIIELTTVQERNAGIELGKLQEKNIAATIKVTGKVAVPPQNTISISVPFGGYLKSMKLLPGMPIKKGQMLASIENAEYVQIQQDYLTAKAQLTFIESEFKRQKDLNDNKAASDKLFEQTKANFQTQQVLVKALEEKLRLIGYNPSSLSANNISRFVTITSPIDGYISNVNAKIGQYIDPNIVILEIIDPKQVFVELTAFEKDAIQVKPGQKLSVFANGLENEKHPCKVSFITQNLSSANSSTIIATFDSQPNNLLPGTFINAQIDLSNKEVKALPSESIVRFEGKHFAFIKTVPNYFEMIEVKVGSNENGYSEIQNADQLVNKAIVIKGAYQLLMALKNSAEE